VVGVGVWFLVDTTLSLYFDVGFNVLFNLVLVLALGVPLFLIRRAFIH
jgi:hypothetical protein